jgi:hypothetical protein
VNPKRAAVCILAFSVASTLAGCAGQSSLGAYRPDITAEEREALSRPLECNGAEQCAFMWRRIQAWVATHAGYKIQTATDVVVETYGASRYSTGWALRILRVPVTPGLDRFLFAASCGDSPRCAVTPGKLEAKFLLDMRLP